MEALKHLKIRTNRCGTNSLKWDQYNDPDIVAMGVADMDFYAPEPVRQALIRCAQEGFFAYAGKPESYYQAIEQWYERRHGWKIKREWLSNVPGVWTGMRICIESFTEPGDALLVHSPHFHPIPSIVEDSRRRLVFNPLVLKDGRYEIDFEAMEETMVKEQVKAFIMINPQNPTGRVFTREELVRIGELCQKHHVVIISDEVHANILFDGHQHTPAGMIKEMEQLCAVITAPSKGYNLQGMTYCILVIPNPQMHERFEVGRHGYDMNFATNVFSMAAIEAAYAECDDWLKECNQYIEENLNYLSDYIQKNIPKISVIRPEGSYMVWLDFRKLGKTPEELKKLLLDAHVGLTYGDTFGPEGNGFERLNIACDRSMLEEGLKRIKDMIDALEEV